MHVDKTSFLLTGVASIRQGVGALGLTLPALMLVALLLFLPFTWLASLSLTDHGTFSFVHYRRIGSGAYFQMLVTTFQLSTIVTLVCVGLAYPLSYMMSQVSQRIATICLLFVVLPFWTSLLVRTYAWLILLQRHGVLNTWLLDWGVIDEPLRLAYSFTGTVIGMVHVLLPFIVFPLYASMQSVDRGYLQAAASMGATPTRVFLDVFVPLSLPGLFAGVVLVFVLCLGFYVTPTILGGGKVLVWSMLIADSVTIFPNWGAASALGIVLVIVTLGVLSAMRRATRA